MQDAGAGQGLLVLTGRARVSRLKRGHGDAETANSSRACILYPAS